MSYALMKWFIYCKLIHLVMKYGNHPNKFLSAVVELYLSSLLSFLHLLHPMAAPLHLPPHTQEWTLTACLYISLIRDQLCLNAPCPSDVSLSGVVLQQGPGPRSAFLTDGVRLRTILIPALDLRRPRTC